MTVSLSLSSLWMHWLHETLSWLENWGPPQSSWWMFSGLNWRDHGQIFKQTIQISTVERFLHTVNFGLFDHFNDSLRHWNHFYRWPFYINGVVFLSFYIFASLYVGQSDWLTSHRCRGFNYSNNLFSALHHKQVLVSIVLMHILYMPQSVPHLTFSKK